MYKIIKDGTAIGMTEAPNYIKQHENGCFVLCPEPEASGIAFAGTAYHLLGREELPDTKSVMLEEVDAGAVIGEVQSGVDRTPEGTGSPRWRIWLPRMRRRFPSMKPCLRKTK